jgi:hypothetical protein
MAYRSTVHESTGCSPNLLMLGREVSLPLDVMMGPPPRAEQAYACHSDYVEWLRLSLKEAFQVAHHQLKTSATRQKRNYDLRVKTRKYEEGQWVWRWYPPHANRKLGKGWTGPYKVVECPTEYHCMLQQAPGTPRTRVHVDLLQPYLGKVPATWGGGDPETDQDSSQTHSDLESDQDMAADSDQEDDNPRLSPEPLNSEDLTVVHDSLPLEPTGDTLVDAQSPPALTPAFDMNGSLVRRRKGGRIRRAPVRLDL